MKETKGKNSNEIDEMFGKQDESSEICLQKNHENNNSSHKTIE